MLHTLELENFRQHQNLAVEFTQGLNVLSGDNGAGKSGILKAIMYCLFGSAATASKKENLTTWGSSGKMECRLTLTIGSKLINITRGLEKSVIYSGEELLASGHTPCTKWVEQELGLDSKTFKHLLYAAQGETQALLKIGAADLQRKLELITKVDGIDRVIKMVGEDLSVLSGKLSMLPAENVTELETKSKQLELEINQLTKSIEDTATMHSQNNETLAQRRRKLNDIAAILEKAKHHEAKRDTLLTSLARIEEDLNELESAKPPVSVKQLSTSIEACKADTEVKRKAVQQSEYNAKFIQGLAVQYSADEAAVIDWTVKQKQAKDYTQLLEDVKQTQAWVAQDKLELSAALDFQSHCPTCNREFDTEATQFHDHRLDELRQKAEASRLAALSANNHLADFNRVTNNEFVNAPSWANRLADLEAAANKSFAAHTAAVGEYKVYDDETINELKSDISRNNVDLEELTLALPYAQRWEREYDSCIQQKARLTSDLYQLGEVVNDWKDFPVDELRQEVEALQRQIQVQYEALIDARYNLKEIGANRLECEKLLAQAVQAREIEKEQADRKELQTYLRNNRARLMNGTWDTITNLTGAYTGDITEGLLSNLSRDESGEFTITEGQHTVPVSELSGGRQSIVGLALRMALGQTFFGEHGFIMLDECSADLTDENAAAVAGFLSGLDTQVIMVTHRGGDLANATNVIVL